VTTRRKNLLKSVGLSSALIAFFFIGVLFTVYLINKVISLIEIWVKRISSSEGNVIIAILSLIFVLLLSFGIIIYILGELGEFLFRKYPSLLLEKKDYKINEEVKKKISIIIPAYNEEKTIKMAINKVRPYCENVIVVDDGSTDKTRDIAKNEGAIVVSHKLNMGLGTSLRDGIRRAIKEGSEIIVNFDADLQYKAEDIPSMIYYLVEDEFDLIMGSRLKGTIEKMSILKRVGNKLYTKLLQYITKTGISDGQTGLRAFTASFAKRIKIRGDFTYTQEMILEATANKAKIGEIPIYFAKREHGKSRLMRNPFHFASASGIFLLKVMVDLNPLKVYSIFSSLILLSGFYLGGTEILDWIITGEINSPNMLIVGMLIMINAVVIESFALLIASSRKNK